MINADGMVAAIVEVVLQIKTASIDEMKLASRLILCDAEVTTRAHQEDDGMSSPSVGRV